jgi:hypothetical protein
MAWHNSVLHSEQDASKGKLLLAMYVLNKRPPHLKAWIFLALAYLLLIGLAGAYWLLLHFVRPVIEVKKTLHPAITYSRVRSEAPNLVINSLDINLSHKEIVPVVTSFVTPQKTLDSAIQLLPAQSTVDFLRSSQAIVAINGGFFEFTELLDPWRYYPHEGDPVTPHGVLIAQGEKLEGLKPGLPALCFSKSNIATIHRHGCPLETWQGLAGAAELVRDGVIQIPPRADDPQAPQTAAALNGDGTKLTLYVVDGRQPGYSDGLTQYALAELVIKHGHTAAISFDGGGSSTMAGYDTFGVRLLNVPINAGIPFRQRYVATHLGIKIR